MGAPPSAELALARLLAKIGRFDDAVEAYARYLKAGDPNGKRVELARAHLALYLATPRGRNPMASSEAGTAGPGTL